MVDLDWWFVVFDLFSFIDLIMWFEHWCWFVWCCCLVDLFGFVCFALDVWFDFIAHFVWFLCLRLNVVCCVFVLVELMFVNLLYVLLFGWLICFLGFVLSGFDFADFVSFLLIAYLVLRYLVKIIFCFSIVVWVWFGLFYFGLFCVAAFCLFDFVVWCFFVCCWFGFCLLVFDYTFTCLGCLGRCVCLFDFCLDGVCFGFILGWLFGGWFYLAVRLHLYLLLFCYVVLYFGLLYWVLGCWFFKCVINVIVGFEYCCFVF